MSGRFNRYMLVGVWGMLLCGMSGAGAGVSPGGDRPGAISDAQAMLELARMLAYDQSRLGESAAMYERLLASNPDDQEILAEALSVYARLGDQQRFDELLPRISSPAAASPGLILLQMRRAAAMGRAGAARGLLAALLEAGDLDDDTWMEIAATVQMWGDFVMAEDICRRRVHEARDKARWRLLLAEVLAGSQNYHAAEAIYTSMLHDDPGDYRALHGLADNFLQGKNHAAALAACARALSLPLSDRAMEKVLVKKAEILAATNEHGRALQAWAMVAEFPAKRVTGLMGQGVALLKSGQPEEARNCFEAVLEHDPGHIAALFYLHNLHAAAGPDVGAFAEKYCRTSELLVQTAGLFAAWQDMDNAEKYYRRALHADPENLIAKRGLATVLAARRKYDPALALYHAMVGEFPESYAINVELARLYAWTRQYRASLDLYAQLRATNPHNPLALTESARVAGWAKQYARSMQFYTQLFTPSVDSILAAKLRQRGIDAGSTGAQGRHIERGAPYEKYARLWDWYFEDHASAATGGTETIKQLLIDMRGQYLTQKSAWLEYMSKQSLYKMHLRESLAFQTELLAFQPGNEEILFDHGQTLFHLGRTRAAHQSYRELLSLSPMHDLAALVLRRSEIQARPGVSAGMELWREKGHDEIADIRWWRTDLGVEIPVMMQNKLWATANRWVYHAGTLENESALGLSLGVDVSLSPAFSVAGSWSGKQADTDEISNTDGFSVSGAWAGPHGIMLGTGYETRDVAQNREGLAAGIQSRDVWAELAAAPAPKIYLACSVRHMDYSDDNAGWLMASSGGYALTDHPKMLNISAHYTYRDTDKVNKYEVANGQRPAPDHYYWTPDNYSAWSVMLSFYHDLSPLLIAGTDRHMYNLKLSAGSDTENNPMLRAEGEWRFEFALRAFTALNVMLHRSRDWQAGQAVFSLGSRF